MPSTLAILVLIPALCWVICTDLLYRRIHNTLVLVLIALWVALPVMALLGQGPWATFERSAVLHEITGSLTGAAIVLLVGYGLFSLGRVGAGDVKLMAVMCLWIDCDDLMAFLIVTALAGGMLALALPLLTLVENTCAQGWLKVGRRYPQLNIAVPTVLTADRPQGIPYGLAIASGAFYTLLFPIHS
ncbi:hypothetical protein PspS35_11470 [Pseudomonas sp. S35]|uniref:A24 family peptidase n=1 Tax=Pseudomonas sp. S35 TaxID=1573719 RepID=UPI00132EF301|nr:prepilin peptidase [Pseudomonas sp. S35]QHF44363.1 hypothetical protein PspS35_11470 [Pseudomonas sp. S35]